jgi:hypothetical protein
MGDRPGNPSWIRTSEDKVRRKDLCGSVRVVYVLEKLPDVSGSDLVEAGRYRTHSTSQERRRNASIKGSRHAVCQGRPTHEEVR